ncbi:MAG: hypothetical protein GY696_25660, partial [Gammaproteobacteria bacterium]|nr:hypothetical protein [Gammaproteobacteria bacterium]
VSRNWLTRVQGQLRGVSNRVGACEGELTGLKAMAEEMLAYLKPSEGAKEVAIVQAEALNPKTEPASRNWLTRLMGTVSEYNSEVDPEELWDAWRTKFERSLESLDSTQEERMFAMVMMIKGSAGEVVQECHFNDWSYNKTMEAVENWMKKKKQQWITREREESVALIPSAEAANLTQLERTWSYPGKKVIPNSQVLEAIVEELRAVEAAVNGGHFPTTLDKVRRLFRSTVYLRRCVMGRSTADVQV